MAEPSDMIVKPFFGIFAKLFNLPLKLDRASCTKARQQLAWREIIANLVLIDLEWRPFV